MTRILMLAAENGALPGGKVGGMGDVIGALPDALAELGCSVTVVTPAYGVFQQLEGATNEGTVKTTVGGETHDVSVVRLRAQEPDTHVEYWALDHPRFTACGSGRIYCDDPPDQPFATDAEKFALFCFAAGECLVESVLPQPDIIHLHDWHTALIALLRAHHKRYRSLRQSRCVFTIHNLAYQGIRPLRGDYSTLQSWSPELRPNLDQIRDPRWPDCLNLMRTGITLSDKTHVVSPTYAKEIQRPSAVEQNGFHGGEGLEQDLVRASREGRLVGILNGCQYEAKERSRTVTLPALLNLAEAELDRWTAERSSLATADYFAGRRIEKWRRLKKSRLLLTSVTRVNSQKIALLEEPVEAGVAALEVILRELGDRGVFVLLGTGDTRLQRFLREVSVRHANFLFLNGFSEDLAEALYAGGDLYLMPSSFEPCGISQMLAMRHGQPCLVHDTGGLSDTINDGIDGFQFRGENPAQQAAALVSRFSEVLTLMETQPSSYQRIREAALRARFPWCDSARAYLRDLYRRPDTTATTQ